MARHPVFKNHCDHKHADFAGRIIWLNDDICDVHFMCYGPHFDVHAWSYCVRCSDEPNDYHSGNVEHLLMEQGYHVDTDKQTIIDAKNSYQRLLSMWFAHVGLSRGTREWLA